MDAYYVKPQKAWQLLNKSRKSCKPVYIFGMSGYGKTELVQQYFRDIEGSTYISCTDTRAVLEKCALIQSGLKFDAAGPITIIFDDLHRVRKDPESEDLKRQIRQLAMHEDVWPVFINRSELTPWLIPVYVKRGVMIISETELALDDDYINRYVEHKGYSFSQQERDFFCTTFRHSAYAFKIIDLVADRIGSCGPNDWSRPDTKTATKEIVQNITEHLLQEETDPEVLDCLIKLSIIDSFNKELAWAVTQNQNVEGLLVKARETGNFIFSHENDYVIRPIPLMALRAMAERQIGREGIKLLRLRAGDWYEQQGQISRALEQYEKCGSMSSIKNLLIINGAENPSNGYYFPLSKYYFLLPEQEITSNIFLMSGMSMTCSILMQAERSEYWYDKLKEYYQKATGAKQREAKKMLYYLDIALPHRGSLSVLDTFRHIANQILSRGITLPEFSVTSNMPSTMNGGKDFCHWSLHDTEIARKYGMIIGLALGSYGKSIINLALGESLYEKGEDSFRVLMLLSRGQMEADSVHNLKMEFVAVALLARLALTDGHKENGDSLITEFELKCRRLGETRLLNNLGALKCRMALYDHNDSIIRSYMDNAPSETETFYIMFRYQYLTKVRCYIRQARYLEAQALLAKLLLYAKSYARTYVEIESNILLAIILWRTKMSSWQETFISAFLTAQHFHFIRIISEEGTAVLPLLQHIADIDTSAIHITAEDTAERTHESDTKIDRKWLLKVLEQTKNMAKLYPRYLQQGDGSAFDLSGNALAILRLQAEGLSAADIGERLGLKVETVRYHIKQNYKKLGVSGKTDAIIAAQKLRLLTD